MKADATWLTRGRACRRPPDPAPTHLRSRRLIALFIVVVAMQAAAVSAAQLAGAGSGSILGVIRDGAGLPVPGAGIAISGRTLITPRETKSGADGTYHFAALPPGEYVLVFAVPGFANVERRARVALGFTLTIDVTLTVAGQQDEVVVTAGLDRHSAAISQAFGPSHLARLPSSRSMGGLFALTHGLVLPTAEVGGGTGIIVGGYGAYGRSNSPRHTLEGIVVTGLFGMGFTPEYGSLDDVSVLTAAHGAEWPSAGVHTDFAVRSGSNEYRGTFYGAGEHQRWQASNVTADQIRRGALAGGGLLPGQVNQVSRNHDVNADVGGFVMKDRLWWYASVRRQDLAARLVNFPVEPYVTRLTNYSGKATYRVSPRHTLVVYGQRGLNHQPYRLDPFGAAGDLSGATAINETRGSTVDQRNRARVWKGEWNGLIGSAAMFEVRVGQFAATQQWSARSTAPRFEDIDTLVVRGGNRDWSAMSRRDQLLGTVSYFARNRTGAHHLRIGGEALRFLVRDTWHSGYPGNVLHVLRSGQPASVVLFETPTTSQAGVWTMSAYASDAWQIDPRVTLTLGVRFDRYRLFLPAQSHTAGTVTTEFAAVSNLGSWNVLTPRLAGVFDVNGDGRTLVKLSVSRYRGAPTANMAFNSNPNSSPWWTRYTWSDVNRNGFWEPGEELLGSLRRRGGTAAESLDPALRLPVVDEAGAWIERTLSGGLSLRAGVIWRLERFQFARQNINQPFEAFSVPVPIRDLGPDGVAGTGDDGPVWTVYDLHEDYRALPPVNVVRTVPGSSSEYVSWEIAVSRRLGGRWTLGAGVTRTSNGDQASGYAGQPLRNNPLPLTPNDLLNAGAGGRYEFSTWTAKAHGTLEGPWRVFITPVLRHQSGQPFGRTQTSDAAELSYGTVTLLMEPVGTRRLDHITLVDVRIEKLVRRNRGGASVFLDVFNCFNANPELQALWTSGSSFLRPLTIVAPRIARVGLTFDW